VAESGQAGDETISDMAGHVSKRMLKHYSHIRMEAKRRAVESIVAPLPTHPVTRPSETNGQPPLELDVKESPKVAAAG
jgi:hypothetical protein